jgi:hypothetical protein
MQPVVRFALLDVHSVGNELLDPTDWPMLAAFLRNPWNGIHHLAPSPGSLQ